MKNSVKFEWVNEEGDELEVELPAKFEVCGSCEGHGSHLDRSIGNHAYSMEEFNESFDEEEQDEYFKRGGRYDVTCEECNGDRVVPVVDMDSVSWPTELPKDEYLKRVNQKAQWERESQYEAQMERRMMGDWD